MRLMFIGWLLIQRLESDHWTREGTGTPTEGLLADVVGVT